MSKNYGHVESRIMFYMAMLATFLCKRIGYKSREGTYLVLMC